MLNGCSLCLSDFLLMAKFDRMAARIEINFKLGEVFIDHLLISLLY